MITNCIHLDFNKENDLKVPSVQYDSGSRFVKIKLQRNKSPFKIDGYRVTVVANKVDGTEIMNDCTILDGVNGVVQFEITEQFNAVEGVVDCQLKLFKGKTLLTSMPFSINVVKSVSTKEIVSSNELKTLVNALGEVQDIDNRFAQTNAQLSQIDSFIETANKKITINPEDFNGTDFEKLQQAIDYAVENKVDVIITNKYDITGQGTLIFKNKTYRDVLNVIGQGGTIEKNDDGFVFDVSVSDTGDIIFNGLKFVSTKRSVYMTNAEKMIRFSVVSCSFNTMGCIQQTNPERYLQSVRILNCTITNCEYPITFYRSYDVTISNNVIEHGIGGIKGSMDADPCCNTVRITDNVIEGLPIGNAIELGSCFGLNISNNYFEANETGNIVLTPNSGSGFLNGLTLIGNTNQNNKGKGLFVIRNLGNNGVLSSGNMNWGESTMYTLATSGTNGRIVSFGDTSNKPLIVNNADRLVIMGNVMLEPYTKTSYFRKALPQSTLVGGNVEIEMEYNLTEEEKNKYGSLTTWNISVRNDTTGGGKSVITGLNWTSTKIYFKIKNLESSSTYFVPQVIGIKQI